MKILVITAATRNLSYQYHLTNPINKEYCDRNNYEHKFIELQDNSDESYFSRQNLLLQFNDASKYDYIMWMDVDAWFNNFNIRLEDVIMDNFLENITLLCARDGAYPSPSNLLRYIEQYVNSGILIFKTGKDMTKLINIWKNQCNTLYATYNDCKFNLQDQFYLCMRILADDFTNSHTKIVESDVLNHTNIFNCENLDDKFILHAAGLNGNKIKYPAAYARLKLFFDKRIQNTIKNNSI